MPANHFTVVMTTTATTFLIALTILSNSDDNWCLGMRLQAEGLASHVVVSKSQPLPQTHSTDCGGL